MSYCRYVISKCFSVTRYCCSLQDGRRCGLNPEICDKCFSVTRYCCLQDGRRCGLNPEICDK